MSRLLRLVLSDRFFFLSSRVILTRQILTESGFHILAQVMRERRKRHGFLLTAWVFLPDHYSTRRPAHQNMKAVERIEVQNRRATGRGRAAESLKGETLRYPALSAVVGHYLFP